MAMIDVEHRPQAAYPLSARQKTPNSLRRVSRAGAGKDRTSEPMLLLADQALAGLMPSSYFLLQVFGVAHHGCCLDPTIGSRYPVERSVVRAGVDRRPTLQNHSDSVTVTQREEQARCGVRDIGTALVEPGAEQNTSRVSDLPQLPQDRFYEATGRRVRAENRSGRVAPHVDDYLGPDQSVAKGVTFHIDEHEVWEVMLQRRRIDVWPRWKLALPATAQPILVERRVSISRRMNKEHEHDDNG